MPQPIDPIKILELSKTDWIKGISLQDTFPIGGIFQSSSYNFDPFETMGYLQPALESAQLDSAINKKPTASVAMQVSGVGYVFQMADRTAGAAKNLFRIKTSDLTVTTQSVTGGSAVGARVFAGCGSYQGQILTLDVANGFFYRIDPSTFAENIVAVGLSGGYNANSVPPAMYTGADQNLYFTKTGSDGKIGKITSAFALTDGAFQGDPNLTPKDITGDGTYLIIIMDENPSQVTNINTKCQVYYWDMDKANADLVQTIPDSYLISARFVDGRLLIIGASGIWQAGIGTQPRLILPLTASQLPINNQAVSVSGNIMKWVAGTSGREYAYGAKIGKPIWYTPFQSNQSAFNQTTLVCSGNYDVVGVDDGASGGKAYISNTGTTRTNATVVTAPNVLPQPFKFDYAKVVLKSKLTTGQAIDLILQNSEGIEIKASDTKYYSASNPTRTFIFLPKRSTTQVTDFEDIVCIINPQGGAVVQRVVIYGTPLADYTAKT